MLSIQTNVNSLVAQQNLNTNSIFQSKTIQQLTSGYRINSSGDDAAGLAVANKFRSMVAELTQGVANGNDGAAQLQIMDGGMNNIAQILDRLKTLAMQSASQSFTGDRNVLNSEFKTDIAEIDRQAQSIGLNNGGTFAKSLAVYLGAGSGSQGASNSVVNVDLSTAMVDSQSLGLTGIQAVNSSAYDLSSTSNTSVSKILQANAGSGTATYKFFGAGFSNSVTGTSASNDGMSVAVTTTGVTDATSLVNAINAQIQKVGAGTTAQASAFKAANIVASVVTDSGGNQKLAFSSNVSGFEAQAGDATSNATMGFFASTTSAAGQTASRSVSTAAIAAGTILVSATGATVLTITGSGITSGGVAVSFSGAANSALSVSAIVSTINSALTAAGVTGVTAQVQGGKITIGDVNGNTLAVAEALGTGATSLGFSTGSSASGAFGKLIANDTYELGSAGTTTVGNLEYTGAVTANQTLSVSANDANGVSHNLGITLTAAETASFALTVGNINDQLQGSFDPTLRQITAVQANVNGVDTINFVSSVKNFAVNIAATTADANTGTTLGLTDSSGAQGKTVTSVQNGTAGSADIGTVAGAQAAVATITAAVAALGSAQANVGKGENNLSFAISLAQSQITNLSAAESNIRDANVAQQAANLTKAQVLQQASIAAMAQANSAPQAVLTLLRG